MIENEIANRAIGIAVELHKRLGTGLLESAYKAFFAHALTLEGYYVECEKAVPLIDDGVKLECGYRIDILVNKCLVLEIKHVDVLIDVHFAQTLTYVKLGGYKLGLLINFGGTTLKSNIKRIINTQPGAIQ
jgi:GxxExxY protein